MALSRLPSWILEIINWEKLITIYKNNMKTHGLKHEFKTHEEYIQEFNNNIQLVREYVGKSIMTMEEYYTARSQIMSH